MKAQALSNKGGGDIWTPQWFFDEFCRRTKIRFDTDAFASPRRKMCEISITKERDAFQTHWTGNVWVQPPYDAETLLKAVQRGQDQLCHGADRLVYLVPAKVETTWWRLLVRSGALVQFIYPRLSFYYPDGWVQGRGKMPPGIRSGVAFPSALVHLSKWSKGAPSRYEYVEYRRPKGADK